MSKVKLLLDVIDSLQSLAASIQAVADGMSENETTSANPKTAPTELPKQSVSLEQLRIVLAEKSRDGYTADVRSLLEKHGASKLSEIDPAKYTGLLSEAEVIGNG